MPPEIEAENLVRFTGTIGYDGQWYHLMAHDPLMKRNYQIYMDHPALRYPRILMPASGPGPLRRSPGASWAMAKPPAPSVTATSPAAREVLNRVVILKQLLVENVPAS